MEIRQIQTFLTIADMGSFSKAAEELGYSQSAVTIQIKQLEKELNTQLFDRIGKQISLTYPGKQFLEHANKIIQDIQEAQAALVEPEELNGTLRIGTIESLCFTDFPNIFREFHALYPGVNISVHMNDPDTLLDMLNHNEVDLVYILDQRIYDSNWVKAMEISEDIVFISSVSHPFADRRQIPLEELRQETFFLTEKDANYRYQLDQYLASLSMNITPFLEISDTEFIINMVKDNLGLSFLPRFTAEKSVSRHQLAILDVENFNMHMWRQLIYHKNKWVTREMLAFIEILNRKVLQ